MVCGSASIYSMHFQRYYPLIPFLGEWKKFYNFEFSMKHFINYFTINFIHRFTVWTLACDLWCDNKLLLDFSGICELIFDNLQWNPRRLCIHFPRYYCISNVRSYSVNFVVNLWFSFIWKIKLIIIEMEITVMIIVACFPRDAVNCTLIVINNFSPMCWLQVFLTYNNLHALGNNWEPTVQYAHPCSCNIWIRKYYM